MRNIDQSNGVKAFWIFMSPQPKQSCQVSRYSRVTHANQCFHTLTCRWIKISRRSINSIPNGLDIQGHRRILKSGTAIEHHRHSARTEGSKGGESTRGGQTPSRKGVRVISPEKFFEFNMSVEAILMHFETIFACKIRLLYRHFM